MANNYIGVGWKKTTKDGQIYISGVLRDLSGDIAIAIFPNNKKEKENQPDFNIVRSEKRENRPVANNNDPFGFSKEEKLEKTEEINLEDIPFD